MPISNSNTAGGAIQGQPQTQQNQPVAKPRQLGSGFTNLQKVIGANKGNQLGNAVSSGIGNRVGQIKNDLGTAQQKFQTDLQGNRVDTEENKSFVNTALNDPYASSQDSNNVSKFQSLLKGDYSGPQGLGNADAINAQAQEAAQYGNSATSAAGRNTLLQRYAGGNKYSQGQQRLDGLLLGQTGANQLKQVRREASGLGNEISGATTLAQAQAQAAAAANKGFASDINNQLGTYDDLTTDENEAKGIYGGIQTDLQARTKAFQDAQKAKYDSLSSAVTSNQYDDNALALMGLTEGQRLYNANLGQYINSYDPSTANIQNVASADDYNKYMALNKLAGRDNSILSNRDLAGTAQTYQEPDKALVKQAIDMGKDVYDSSINPLLTKLQGQLAGTYRYAGPTSDEIIWNQANNIDDIRNLKNAYGPISFNDNIQSQLDAILNQHNSLYGAEVLRASAGGKPDYVPDNLPGGGKSMKG